MLYYLSQRPDGRVVLDRQSYGEVIQEIKVREPSIVRRLIGEDWVDVPQWHESYSDARSRVDEAGLIQSPEGWFRGAAGYLAYVRARMGELE